MSIVSGIIIIEKKLMVYAELVKMCSAVKHSGDMDSTCVSS